MNYIDKDDLISELEKLRQELGMSRFYDGYDSAIIRVESIINKLPIRDDDRIP